MLRRKQLLWAVVGLVVIACPSVWAMDMAKDISGEVSVDYFGKYIWRGQALTDDPVLQPSITFNCPEDKFHFNIWANMDLTTVNGTRNDFTEVDYTLSYTDALPGVDGIGYEAGIIYYTFGPDSYLGATGNPHDTSEIYGGLSFENCPYSPTVTLYYNLEEVAGFYGNVAISHSLEISEMGEGMQNVADSVAEGMLSTIDLSASLGAGDDTYNRHYWSSSAPTALNDLVLSLAIPVKVCDSCTITGSVNYVSLIDGSISKYSYNGDKENVYGGVGMVVPF